MTTTFRPGVFGVLALLLSTASCNTPTTQGAGDLAAQDDSLEGATTDTSDQKSTAGATPLSDGDAGASLAGSGDSSGSGGSSSAVGINAASTEPASTKATPERVAEGEPSQSGVEPEPEPEETESDQPVIAKPKGSTMPATEPTRQSTLSSPEADADEPDAPPDSVELDSVEPDSAEPDSVEPDSAEPDSAEPDSAEPDSAEPDSAEPDSAEPDSAEPNDTPSPEPWGENCDSPVVVEEATVQTSPQYGATNGQATTYALCPGESTGKCRVSEEGSLQAWGTLAERWDYIGTNEDGAEFEYATPPAVSSGCSSLNLHMEGTNTGGSERLCCREGALGALDYVYTCQPDSPDGIVCHGGDECLANKRCLAGVCTSDEPLVCDDGLYCNGLESCDPALGCQFGVPPYQDDNACTVDICEEAAQSVDHSASAVCEGLCSSGVVVQAAGYEYPGQLDQRPYLLQEARLECGQKSSFAMPAGRDHQCALNAVGEVYITDQAGRVLSAAVSQGCVRTERRWEGTLTGTWVVYSDSWGCCIGEALNCESVTGADGCQ